MTVLGGLGKREFYMWLKGAIFVTSSVVAYILNAAMVYRFVYLG